MPENPHASSSIPEPGEFDFADTPPGQARIRRRSLRVKPAVQRAEEEEPTVSPPVEEEPIPDSQDTSMDAPTGAAPSTPPAAARYTPPASRPAAPAATPTGSSGLYYSTGASPRKEDAPTPTPSMKTTTPPAATTGPAAAYRSLPSAATASRPASVSDYRANVERQAREQRSVGNVLAYIVYAIGALLILGAGLAIYGGYTLSRQIHEQSMTINDLDARYSAQNLKLTQALTATDETLAQAQAQIRREQELILRQQDSINQLVTANNDCVAAIRQERSARAEETASLRTKIRSIEETPRLGQ
jgi:hypothetical protein